MVSFELFQASPKIVFSDVSAFLPPGYNLDKAKDGDVDEDRDKDKVKDEGQAKDPPPSEDSPKLSLSSLFDKIETVNVASLLPPGFDPAAAEADEGGEPPAAQKKPSSSPSRSPRPKGPPAVVPKIKSFSDRSVSATNCGLWVWIHFFGLLNRIRPFSCFIGS